MRIILSFFLLIFSISAFSQNVVPLREIQNDQLMSVIKSFSNVLDSLEREELKARISKRHVIPRAMIALFISQFSIEDSIPSSSEQGSGYIAQSFDLNSRKLKTQMKFELSPDFCVYDFALPSFYFFIDERPVLVYTGFEKMWEPNKKAEKKLSKKLKEFVNCSVGAIAPHWIVEITDDNINYLFRNL